MNTVTGKPAGLQTLHRSCNIVVHLRRNKANDLLAQGSTVPGLFQKC